MRFFIVVLVKDWACVFYVEQADLGIWVRRQRETLRRWNPKKKKCRRKEVGDEQKKEKNRGH